MPSKHIAYDAVLLCFLPLTFSQVSASGQLFGIIGIYKILEFKVDSEILGTSQESTLKPTSSQAGYATKAMEM